MKRETRANLIFLSVFLAISLPGAVILFKKKLDPRAPPMFMPDYVKRRLPYMAPQRTPADQVVRFVPDLTGQWVDQLNQTYGSRGAQVLMNRRQAITSDDHLIQLVSVIRVNSITTVHLIAWDDSYGTDLAQYQTT